MELDASAAAKKNLPEIDHTFSASQSKYDSYKYRVVWTDGQIEQLKQLWVDGLSASQIGSRLGFSRNAILGKVFRLCLPHREIRAKPALVPRERKPRKARIAKIKIARTPSVIARTTYQPIVASNPTSFLKLQPHHCRWVLGDPAGADTMFCGAVVAPDKRYCLGHCNIAYRGWWHAA